MGGDGDIDGDGEAADISTGPLAGAADEAAAARLLAAWFEAEWTPWYGPDGAGDALADLTARPGVDGLPAVLVARDPAGAVVGTATLRAGAVAGEPGPGPWLAALLVGPAWRGRGVGRVLLAAVEAEARRLGFAGVSTSTGVMTDLLARRGWRRTGEAGTLRGTVPVWRLDFPEAGG